MIRSFSNLDDLFSAMDADRGHADLKVEPWQENLKPGDFFLRIVDGVYIYGEVLDPALPTWENASEEDLEELRESAELYKEDHMKHFRFCRCFSRYCPEGELGDVHVSTVSLFLHSDDFAAAKESNWLL